MVNYEKIGLKCGLEIHRQLDTLKLFCSCPSTLREDKPDFTVKRELRAVPGEHGEIDVAAIYEQFKGKYFIYEGHDENSCLVELDEEPIHPINKEALEVSLQICLMLKCKIPDTIQIMRKTVVDGSNTSGFQRTALIGRDGILKTNRGEVNIANVSIEEDAARIIKKEKNFTIFRLDRLGIPLIEIGTGPDIKNPEQCKEVAEKIGMILRSTGKVKRGIGTIRQDVNVSIKKGARVEIKGVQDLRLIPLIVKKEVERQLSLIGKGEKVQKEVRKANPDGTSSFLRPMPGAARLYPETDLPLVKPNLKGIKTVELIREKVKRFEKLGLGKDLAPLMAGSEKAELFEETAKKYKDIKPAFIAETLTGTLAELKRDYQVEDVRDSDLKKVFEYLNEGKIHKDIMLDVLIDMAKGQFDIKKYEGLKTEDLHKELLSVIKENKGAPFGALMGKAMAKLKGKASGEKVAKMLKELVEKGH